MSVKHIPHIHQKKDEQKHPRTIRRRPQSENIPDKSNTAGLNQLVNASRAHGSTVPPLQTAAMRMQKEFGNASLQRSIENSLNSPLPATFQGTTVSALLQRQEKSNEGQPSPSFQVSVSSDLLEELSTTTEFSKTLASGLDLTVSNTDEEFNKKFIFILHETIPLILDTPVGKKIAKSVQSNPSLRIASALLKMIFDKKPKMIARLNACYGAIEGEFGLALIPQTNETKDEKNALGPRKFSSPVVTTQYGIQALDLGQLKLPSTPIMAYAVIRWGGQEKPGYVTIDSSAQLSWGQSIQLTGQVEINAWFTSNLMDPSIGFGAGAHYKTELGTDTGNFLIVNIGGTYLKGFGGAQEPAQMCVIINLNLLK